MRVRMMFLASSLSSSLSSDSDSGCDCDCDVREDLDIAFDFVFVPYTIALLMLPSWLRRRMPSVSSCQTILSWRASAVLCVRLVIAWEGVCVLGLAVDWYWCWSKIGGGVVGVAPRLVGV